MHRHKTLKDEDLVPADSVDNGEQEEVEEVLNGEGLDLSYLWVVDANSLGPQPRSSTDTQEKHTISITTSDDEQVSGASTRTWWGVAFDIEWLLWPLWLWRGFTRPCFVGFTPHATSR